VLTGAAKPRPRPEVAVFRMCAVSHLTVALLQHRAARTWDKSLWDKAINVGNELR